MTGRHDSRFTGRVVDYARYRTRYPVEVMEILRVECGLTQRSMVADVGAGTGMLAEMFLENGNRVVAAEPNAEMRAECKELVGVYPGLLRVVDAVAESTGLEDGSMDFVVVGRAFHWFDRERALVEFKRVLRLGGWVVLVSSGRPKTGGEQVIEFERILMEHGTDYAGLRERYRLYDEMPPVYGGAVVRRTIKGEQQLGWEAFVGQVRSLSVTPLIGNAGYEAMEAALQGYFERFAVGGVLRMETVCSLLACQVD